MIWCGEVPTSGFVRMCVCCVYLYPKKPSIVSRLQLRAPMDFWQNSGVEVETPSFGAAAFRMTKNGNFRR